MIREARASNLVLLANYSAAWGNDVSEPTQDARPHAAAALLKLVKLVVARQEKQASQERRRSMNKEGGKRFVWDVPLVDIYHGEKEGGCDGISGVDGAFAGGEAGHFRRDVRRDV